MSKLTYLQEQVRKEMERINNFLRRKEKLGYQFNKLPNLEFDPKKARTRQLKMLRNLTSNRLLREKSEWVDPETGEIFEGKQAVAAQKTFARDYGGSYSEAVQQYQYEPYEQDTEPSDVSVYDKVREIIESLPSSGYSTKYHGFTYFEDQKGELLSMLDDLVGSAEDEEEVYNYLRENEAEITQAGQDVAGASSSETIKESYTHIARILNRGLALTQEQSEHLEAEHGDYASEYDFDGLEW